MVGQFQTICLLDLQRARTPFAHELTCVLRPCCPGTCQGVYVRVPKERALRAVQHHLNSESDRFWHGLVVADQNNVRHFAYQFHLFGGNDAELSQLASEWVLLCENSSLDPQDDELVHDRFAEVCPTLHARQKLYVDPCMTDTLMREAEFSVRRRLKVKQLTAAGFEQREVLEPQIFSDLRTNRPR